MKPCRLFDATRDQQPIGDAPFAEDRLFRNYVIMRAHSFVHIGSRTHNLVRRVSLAFPNVFSAPLRLSTLAFRKKTKCNNSDLLIVLYRLSLL